MVGDTLVFAESTQFNLCGFDRKLLGHSTAFSDPLLGAKTLRKLKAEESLACKLLEPCCLLSMQALLYINLVCSQEPLPSAL